MKAFIKQWHQDKEGMIALLILIAVVLLYLTAMAIWIRYEWHKPITDYKVWDVGGHAVAAKLSFRIWNKLFKRDRG